MKKILGLLSLFLAVQTLPAATIANDVATNPAYAPDDANPANDANPASNTNGWVAGDNGGTGFGAWTFATTGAGGRYLGSTGLPSGGNTFGVFAGGATGNTSSVNRPLTGALSSGQNISLSLGVTGVSTGGEVGVNLLNGATTVFTLKFVGGDTFWKLNDGATDFSNSQGFAANTALNFTFTYNGGQSYSYTFGAASGSNFTATSTITNIDGVRVFSNSQGSGQNIGFNNLAVAPEPSTMGLLGLSGLGIFQLFRRKSR